MTIKLFWLYLFSLLNINLNLSSVHCEFDLTIKEFQSILNINECDYCLTYKPFDCQIIASQRVKIDHHLYVLIYSKQIKDLQFNKDLVIKHISICKIDSVVKEYLLKCKIDSVVLDLNYVDEIKQKAYFDSLNKFYNIDTDK